jgi:hypothetical protein
MQTKNLAEYQDLELRSSILIMDADSKHMLGKKSANGDGSGDVKWWESEQEQGEPLDERQFQNARRYRCIPQ